MLSYEELTANESRLLAMTSLTEEEFQRILPMFEQAYVDDRSTWTNEGRQRHGRRHTTYKNSPLPTPQARLLFVLVYLKQAPSQEVQGQLFRMTQSNTNKWLHILLPVLETALAADGLLPTRTLAELQARLVASQQLRPGPRPQQTSDITQAPAPLFSTTAPSAPSLDPLTPKTGLTTTAAKRKAIR